MATITIKNVGPIKSASLELNKVNVFMGPQCSGKSTIAKIISFCMWVEKKISLNQSFSFFEKENNFVNELVVFHKLKGYFRNESSIEYESDVLKFQYDHSKEKTNFEWKNRYNFKRSKISYIPSERNLVSAIENWFDVRFKENNIFDFMKEWEDARKVYTKDSPLSILELGVKYYYDEKSGHDFVIVDKEIRRFVNNGKILVNNGKTLVLTEITTLELTNTSSGLQSLIPLILVTEYVTARIYEKSNIRRSVRDEQLEFFIKDKIDIKKIQCFLDNHYTQFIIEEPEQNLFPSTQRDLVYHLLKLVTGERDHRLTITTHSPYILYALNNCMLGKLVYEKMDDEDRDAIVCKSSLINPKDVSIYQIDGGILKNIQQEDGLIGSNFFDEKMKEIMDDFYLLLKYYDDER